MPQRPRRPQVLRLHDLRPAPTPPFRSSALPAIDRITGRVVTGLLALIAMGVVGSLGVAVYRLVS